MTEERAPVRSQWQLGTAPLLLLLASREVACSTTEPDFIASSVRAQPTYTCRSLQRMEAINKRIHSTELKRLVAIASKVSTTLAG